MNTVEHELAVRWDAYGDLPRLGWDAEFATFILADVAADVEDAVGAA